MVGPKTGPKTGDETGNKTGDENSRSRCGDPVSSARHSTIGLLELIAIVFHRRLDDFVGRFGVVGA